jgi:hypothetical protein
MIARQFIAWYSMQKGTRPVGNGMIGSSRRAATRTINQPWVRIRPSLRDGFSIGRVPGNKLPATIIQSLRDVDTPGSRLPAPKALGGC